MDRQNDEHLVAVPGTGWSVWRPALLRSTGFPIDGLDMLGDRELAAAVDARLDEDRLPLEDAFAASTAATTRALHGVACDESFRMAVTWQNPAAAATLDSAVAAGPEAVRNSRHRRREDLIAKYWQRYCAKNDTVGFFGPMCWTSLVDDGPPVRATVSDSLVRDRAVHLEWWALTAVGEVLAQDPEMRPWFPVTLSPQLAVEERDLVAPDRPSTRLTGPVSALLEACRTAPLLGELAERMVSEGHYQRPGDVVTQVDDLERQGVVLVGVDLPVDLSAEAVLHEHLTAIGDTRTRARAHAALERLTRGRDAAAAATSATELQDALTALDAAFTEVTGREPRHRPGQTYAGRTLCHLETSRDLDITFGPHLVEKLAPLGPLLESARWLSGAAARAYHDALSELHGDLAIDGGTDRVPLRDLWFLAQGAVFGKDAVAGPVVDDFLARWNDVLGFDETPIGTRELRFASADLATRVAEAFPDDGPGWWQARIHSPDLHVCAPDLGAVERGDYRLVLGELHIGVAALNTDFFRLGHPEPSELERALVADMPGGRVELLLPEDWPRNCARNADWIHGPHDVQLGFAAARGAVRERLLPVTGLVVVPGGHGLDVVSEDGRRWPLLEVFGQLLNIQTFDTWKLAGRAEHVPRVVVDDLVLTRETWRTTVAATGLADATGEYDRFVAARRWRRTLDLPERVFVRVHTETKPFYVDLTSPLYVRQLCTMLRSAAQRAGGEVALDVTEMLPTAEDAWLTDAAGRRYASELRLHLRDPRVPLHSRDA